MPLTEYAPNIWILDYPIRFAGSDLFARTTVVRLGDGRLWVHSPGPLDAATRAAVDALGPVAFIIAPGNYHHLYVRHWKSGYPTAEVHICPGVKKKQPDLAYTQILGDTPPPGWADDFDQALVKGTRFIREVAFFHRASKTLILTDLIENYGDHTTARLDWKMRFWWKIVFRMWNRPKPAPEYQMGWKDKTAAKRSLQRILDWDFERIILAHGDLIDDNAKAVATAAWRSVLKAGT